MAINKGRVCIVLGTRPEIIKMFPVIKALQAERIPYLLVHTNQHYSKDMDAVFFRELGLRAPHFNLKVRAQKSREMVEKMVKGLERIFERTRPAVILAEGDTNSVLAAALAAKRCGIPFGHIEAGLRSFDHSMPEEVNRIAADRISALLFAPTYVSQKNLKKEGITKGVHVVGNTIVDAVEQGAALAKKKSKILRRLALTPKKYSVLTLHRQANADNPARVHEILKGVAEAASAAGLQKVIFPVHPRTKKTIEKGVAMPAIIHAISPIGFIDMVSLVSSARIVFTDSGGLQEETCIIKVPCVTLRENTERPETLSVGGNILAGRTYSSIVAAAQKMMRKKIRWYNPFGARGSGKRIVRILRREL